jgi:nitrate reductase gamma subunit
MESVRFVVALLFSSPAGPEPSWLLRFAEDKLQIIALAFMAVVYILKVRWILSFNAGKERQAGTGDPATSGPRGAWWSLFNIAMPWAMTSTRQHPLFWLSFAVFHSAVAVSIAMSLLLPYWPELFQPAAVVYGLKAVFAGAVLIGTYRMVRRLVNPYVKAISTPDDYFSLGLLIVWFGFAFKAVENDFTHTEFWLLGYFLLTAFFLFYVPFSKISHYIYYPFTRWYLGKTMGHRGVYPLRLDLEEIKRMVFRPNQFVEGKGK